MAKILATIYMSVLFFFCIWYMVFQINEYIDRMKARKRMQAAKEPERPPEPESIIDIVGKSSTVFLAPLTPVSKEPFMSDDLEKEPAAQAEPDILPEAVEANLNSPVILEDDELDEYSGDITDLEGNFSKGLTYQQISDAIDVVEGRKSGEMDEYLAGETFCIMPDDFLNVICMQTEHEIIVKKLIEGYVDSVGKKKPPPALVANFDINLYV